MNSYDPSLPALQCPNTLTVEEVSIEPPLTIPITKQAKGIYKVSALQQIYYELLAQLPHSHGTIIGTIGFRRMDT